MTELDDIRARIEQEVEKARNLSTNPPNEQCTCDWVIRPLLEAAGYDRFEIVAQDPVSGGGTPDFTILPDTDWTWYLEAKTWDKNLENGTGAVQAVNYANSKGRRWVVLSNGRQWLLFDNYLSQVEAPQRVVAMAELRDRDFADFLLALSKPSITGNRLEQYVARARVRRELDRQLSNKDSEVVKAITKTLSRLGIAGVQSSDVVDYFASLSSGLTALPPVADAVPAPASAAATGNKYTLAQLFNIRDRLDYTKPARVTFPDHSSSDARNWADVACRIVEWLGARSKLPKLPWRATERCRRWFLSHDKDQISKSPKRTETPGGAVYLEANTSTAQFVHILNELCKSVGEPPDGFVIELSREPAPE